MRFFYRMLRQDPSSREGVVVVTSALGILVNLLMAVIKIVLGIAVSSIAIISEGMNNASDSATSLLAIVGTKLSAKHPTQKYPFGFGRIEYLTSLIIAVLILFTGFELLSSSIKLIFNPTQLSISYLTLAFIAASAVLKFLLGLFTIREGKRVDSASLIAVGTESRNDSLMSVVTILSALIFLLFRVCVDAYAGVLISLVVLKAGLDILKETLSNLLGHAGERELAETLYSIIRAEPIVLNAADMMLHNYGPDAYTGSVNIEIDHEKTVSEVYAAIHALQLRIMHEMKIAMVFGIYAVDHDHEEMKHMRQLIAQFIRSHEHVLSYHALYIDPNNYDIYCDLVVDYELLDWEQLRREFTAYMAEHYPASRLELVIETSFV